MHMGHLTISLSDSHYEVLCFSITKLSFFCLLNNEIELSFFYPPPPPTRVLPWTRFNKLTFRDQTKRYRTNFRISLSSDNARYMRRGILYKRQTLRNCITHAQSYRNADGSNWRFNRISQKKTLEGRVLFYIFRYEYIDQYQTQPSTVRCKCKHIHWYIVFHLSATDTFVIYKLEIPN